MESRDREERINEETVVGGSHLGEEQEEEKEKIDPFLKGESKGDWENKMKFKKKIHGGPWVSSASSRADEDVISLLFPVLIKFIFFPRNFTL